MWQMTTPNVQIICGTCNFQRAIFQVICGRAWIPADDDESGTDPTLELWDQSTETGWKAPEIDLADGRSRTLVLE